ncbi:Stk1 family PASTA domain-containing Ser/Thr kinase [Halosaccharopolyspora lacisalsi]
MSSPRLLSNRYEIGDTLGYGGMSEVHHGRDIRLGRDVAVKVLRADLARDPTFQLRFRREAQNAAALNHPAIVAVYDTGETESENGPLPYIVMEYVEGQTLRDIVKTEGPLAPRRAMEVMADSTAALDFSHRHGIVHRDVKPANIMITESGAVKVMDFGIARAVADGQAAVTQTAAVIGTAQYLSPEQARGETVDARSDVYSSGCVLFELLTGEPPFTGDSPVAVAYQHVREEPRKPSDDNEQVPAALDAVVLKALSKNSDNRYQSAAEMRSDLVRVLSGQRPKAPMVMTEDERTSMMAGPPTAESTATTRRAVAPIDADEDPEQQDDGKRRRRWTIGLVTAACLAVFALVSWVAYVMMTPEEPKTVAIPDVQGQQVPAATRALNDLGLTKLSYPKRPSTEAEKGKVVHITPPVGTQVGPNKPIKLYVGSGPDMIDVPDLTGKTMPEAQEILSKAGLKLNVTPETKTVTDSSKVNKILDQSETGEVKPNTMITVTVGEAIEKARVLDVTNLPLSAAKQTLESAGFNVSVNRVDSPKPAGTVLEQNPEGGSSARPDSTVTLTVSNGSQITVPGNLRGMSEDAAKQALQSQGWNGSISTQRKTTTDKSLDDKVVGTQPPAGSKIGRNQSITLLIGDYESESSTTTPPTESSGLFPGFD